MKICKKCVKKKVPEVDYAYAFNARLAERGKCAICNEIGANVDIDTETREVKLLNV